MNSMIDYVEMLIAELRYGVIDNMLSEARANMYMYPEELRFNPYHDPSNGRFTSGGGSGSGVDKSGGSGIINKAKAIDMFNDSELPPDSSITTKQIINELSTTSIGWQTLKDIESLPELIKLTYESKGGGIRGEERNGSIIIYLQNCKNPKWAARSVVHEVTHYKYGIGYSQWAECVCVAQELKHARNRDNLTVNELRTIVSAVKDAYPEFNWRKGGVINGRNKSH